MTELDWKWFDLCMVLLALFAGSGALALYWRGCWTAAERRAEAAENALRRELEVSLKCDHGSLYIKDVARSRIEAELACMKAPD